MSFAFPSRKRLGKAGVLAVLRRGKRLKRDAFEVKFVISRAKNSSADSKLAISVPKRLLKSSVARNRIKRIVREEFRVHRAATAPLHLLVIYLASDDARHDAARRILRAELANMFDDAVRCLHADNIGVRAK